MISEVTFGFLRLCQRKNKYVRSMGKTMDNYIRSSYIYTHHFSFVHTFVILPSPCAVLKKSLFNKNFFSTLPCHIQLRGYAKKAIVKESKGKGHKPKVYLTDEEMMSIIDLNAYRSQLQFVIDDLRASYVDHLSIRTSAGSIEKIPVKIDNEEYPLNELAQISRKNPHLIVLNLSSFPEALKPVIQAIHDSGMGLNPQQEGTTIYLPIPKITREHREMLVKNAKTMCVKAKDDIKNIQNKFIKEARKQTELSKDIIFNSQEQIKYLAEQSVTELEKVMKIKQQEILGDN